MPATTTSDLRDRFVQFRKASQSTATLCNLLGTDKFTLERLAIQPRYKVFHLPKNIAGDLRLIEDPAPVLKKVQFILNQYLQSAYYFEKSNAGYGFVVNPITDEDRRNILTNARKHLGRPWLLQLDLCDFFHSVTEKKVREIFESSPLFFKEDAVDLLTAITTYQGRLPMGAPTSPVLSNFACRDLDESLQAMATTKNWTYTRYADDLSISSKRLFTDDERCTLRLIIQDHGFMLNEQKTLLYGPDDEKIVTGILLRGKGELRPGFFDEVKQEVRRLASVIEAQHFHGELRTHWVEKMKHQLRGKIAFVGFVLGVRNTDYIQLRDDFYSACAPPEEEFGAVSWKGFNYLK
jgi:RNA-directed DNA polymerase